MRAALVEAIRYDGPEKPLPFELVLATLEFLSGLDHVSATRFLSIAEGLKLWSHRERLWLLYTRVQRLGAQPQAKMHWRRHAIPVLSRIFSDPRADSTLKGLSAFRLALEGSGDHLIPALIGTPAPSTKPGHYVARLKLWREQQANVIRVLPNCVQGFADAWTRLGLTRLPDRASTTVLLALGLSQSQLTHNNGLIDEIKALLREKMIPEVVRQNIAAGLEAISEATANAVQGDQSRPNHPLLPLLQTARAATAVSEANSLSRPTTANEWLWEVVLLAEAKRRARSSSAALSALRVDTALLTHARSDIKWAFYFLKAAIHWSRLEYHNALLEVEAARLECGVQGDADFLFRTHSLRRKIAGDLKLSELVSESDDVLAAINHTRELRSQPPLEPHVAISEALGTDYEGYRKTLTAIRTAAQRADSGHVLDSRDLTRLVGLWRSIQASKQEEAFHYAQLCSDIAYLMLMARTQWTEDLYRRYLKPILDDAVSSANEVEAFKLLEHLDNLVKRARVELAKINRPALLTTYEIPSLFASASEANRYGIERIIRYLNAADNTYERRWSLRAAYRSYSNHLDLQDSSALSQADLSTLLGLLQELKQPSLESDRWLSNEVSHAEHDLEEIRQGTADSETIPSWQEAVEERLRNEDAACLDFFVGRRNLYCFVIDTVDDGLRIKLVRVPIVGFKGDPRQLVNQWRARCRATMESFGASAEEADLHMAATRIEYELGRYGTLVPEPLETSLGRTFRVIYVGPHLGLHGLPLHQLRAPNSWSLSKNAPVLRIAKTRDLGRIERHRPAHSVQIICGPDAEFARAKDVLLNAFSASEANPRTREALIRALATHDVNVLLGHGWFDKDRPLLRSRIALDHGLRLTLQDLQDVRLHGSEIILLSCWNGWGTRSGLPIGEIYNAPTAWVSVGAASVLAPLWPIPVESGAKFIRDYASARLSGESRAVAYANAQRDSDTYAFGSLCSSAFCMWGRETSN